MLLLIMRPKDVTNLYDFYFLKKLYNFCSKNDDINLYGSETTSSHFVTFNYN